MKKNENKKCDSRVKPERAVVDAQFCPGYCVYFIILGLGPICDEFSNLGLEPCHFLLFIESLSNLVLVILFRI